MKKFILYLPAIITAILLITACGQNTPPPTCAVCGSDKHVAHPPCSVCGINNHISGTCCSVCYSTEHTVTEHPFCTNCGSMYHSAEKCDLAGSVYCEICRDNIHNTSEHPMCEIPGCDKKEFHSTDLHPVCGICGRKHSPYCEGGNDARICGICGAKHSSEHLLCDICGSAFHAGDSHPACTRCNEKHVERDTDCPNFCTICMNLQHSTEDHPKCSYCNSTAHTSDGHVKCSICGNKHSPDFVCAPAKPKKGSEDNKPSSDEDPQKGPANEPQKKDPCSICSSTEHTFAGHPKCSVCGNKHRESAANCPNKKAPSSGKGNLLCNNCGPESDHTTEFCIAVSCTYCGRYGHTEDNCEEKNHADSQDNDDIDLSVCTYCGRPYTPQFGCVNSMCPSNQ